MIPCLWFRCFCPTFGTLNNLILIKIIIIIIFETSFLFSVIVIHTIIHKKSSNTPAIIINGSCYTNAKQYHDEKICNNCGLDCWVTGTVYLVWFGNYCLSNHLNSVSDHFSKFMQFKNLEMSEIKPKGVISMVKRLSEQCDTEGKRWDSRFLYLFSL